MANLFRSRNIAIALVLLVLYLALQACFAMHALSAGTITTEYLGREVSRTSRQEGIYPNGKYRWTYEIPPFEHQFRMHEAVFEWNENHFVPPDAETEARDKWIGTCTLTPKSPWREIDFFGVLGPMEYTVYGDWYVESSP